MEFFGITVPNRIVEPLGLEHTSGTQTTLNHCTLSQKLFNTVHCPNSCSTQYTLPKVRKGIMTQEFRPLGFCQSNPYESPKMLRFRSIPVSVFKNFSQLLEVKELVGKCKINNLLGGQEGLTDDKQRLKGSCGCPFKGSKPF